MSPVTAHRGITTGRSPKNTFLLKLSRWMLILLSLPPVGTSLCRADGWDTHPETWAATDGLNRTVAENATTGNPKTGKYAGIFYYIWQGQHGTALYDISKILAQNPPPWGPAGAFHFRSEPLYGYYKSDDEWVMRKNAQMLADAGVDVIFLDNTNATTYRDIYLKLCRVYTDIRKAGGKTPQIAFITWSSSGHTVQKLYDEFYSTGQYKDLWFEWEGKPLILAKPAELTPALASFFTVRSSWAWDPGQNKWPWLEHSPQQGGWTTSPQHIEEMVAETAEHPISNIGKSFHNGHEPSPNACQSGQGLYFAEQIKRALAVNPQFLFITQWNEWMAQRFVASGGAATFVGQPLKPGDTFFVDVYSTEFNRDIEPMKGGYQDNYYYQMVDAIRRFKGTRSPESASPPTSIPLDDFNAWSNVRPEYRDDVGDVFHRDAVGMDDIHYVNSTGRNDFKILKVARSKRALAFYAETVAPITPPGGSNWMNLFIGVEGVKSPAWAGFQYRVQPLSSAPDSPLVLEKFDGVSWNQVAHAPYRMSGNKLVIRIPRSALGLPATTACALSFKWADNMQSEDPTDWIINGDTAPNGRFRYRYLAK